ncbi:MAG: acyltransferase [Candidatus Onthomonas sp.]
MEQKRNINFDLLRIICMLMVVCLHSLNHGGLVEQSLIPGSANFYLGNTLFSLCLLAVNCFVMLSGYFLCTANFKLKKLVSIWGQALFYSVSITCIQMLLNAEQTFSLKEFAKSVFVVTMSRYWFVTAYLLMYAVSPFLNCALRAMDKKTHLLCCGTLLGIFSVLHNIVYISDFGHINGGYSFLWFCILYVIAAYFRFYIPTRIKHQNLLLPAYFVCALCICAERFLAYWITPHIFGTVKLTSLFYSYNSIMNVLAAFCLFQFFRGITIQGTITRKLISFFAPLTFSVYLISDHQTFRPVLWSWLHPSTYFDSPWMIPYVLVCVLFIFIVCCAIEWCRKYLCAKIGLMSGITYLCDSIQNKITEAAVR